MDLSFFKKVTIGRIKYPDLHKRLLERKETNESIENFYLDLVSEFRSIKVSSDDYRKRLDAAIENRLVLERKIYTMEEQNERLQDDLRAGKTTRLCDSKEVGTVFKNIFMADDPMEALQEWIMELAKEMEFSVDLNIDEFKRKCSRVGYMRISEYKMNRSAEILENISNLPDKTLQYLRNSIQRNTWKFKKYLHKTSRIKRKLDYKRERYIDKMKAINITNTLKEATRKEEKNNKAKTSIEKIDDIILENKVVRKRKKFYIIDSKVSNSKGKWFGFNIDKNLKKLIEIFGGTQGLLKVDQSSCNQEEFIICMKLVDDICTVTRSKQGLITHIVYAERFGLLSDNMNSDEFLQSTYPIELYSSEMERNITMASNTGKLKYLIRDVIISETVM